jgi:3-oxoacyl-[acyl-carrier protein] reductase
MSAELDSLKLRVLVLGGTGYVGSQVVKLAAEEGYATVFTYSRSVDQARALSLDTQAKAERCDFLEPGSIETLLTRLEETDFVPDALIIATVQHSGQGIQEVTEEEWMRMERVNNWGPVQVLSGLKKSRLGSKLKNVVFLGALAPNQSLPLPVGFAGTQGKSIALAMALARDPAMNGICVNLVAIGALSGGVSKKLPEKGLKDFQEYSALRRLGKSDEVASACLWLATQNSYMNGKVVSVNGGI